MPQELYSAEEDSRTEERMGTQSDGRTTAVPVSGPHNQWSTERWLLRRLIAAMGDPSVAFVMPDGSEIVGDVASVDARVRVRKRAAIWKIAWDPLFQFPECYARGEIEVDQLEPMLRVVFERLNQNSTRRQKVDRIAGLLHPSRSNSLRRARSNIYQHYDLGNDFYRLWLDERMVYTCAYFAEPSMTLEQAQLAKMDHVCRKLCLQPGMQVIEAGCGWGSLALHMAKHYGVRVQAFNISKSQIEFARQRAVEEGLQPQVEFIEDDWRNISGQCDAFVSVGMLEHLGRGNYRLLGDVIARSLKQGGVGLVHSIGQNDPRPLNPWIEQRIFPGAYPPTLQEMMGIFEPHRFSIIDVENLRPHYAETLQCWLERFEQHTDALRERFDETFVRSWRFYLTGSMLGFVSGSLQLFQIVFANGLDYRYPRTRAFLYN